MPHKIQVLSRSGFLVAYQNLGDKLTAMSSAQPASVCEAVATGTLFRNPSDCTELPYLLTDLSSTQLPPVIADSFEGTVVIQPFAASWSSAYIPFLNRTPDEIHAAGTILVYRGKFDFSEIAAQRRFERGLRMFGTDPAGARAEFAAAEPHCPESLRDWLRDMLHATTPAKSL